jgi:predicted flap endonuclease-1-like 5' DNA nuclease
LRGKAIWILSFFTFLSALNAITAVVLSINLGIQANFQPYLISGLTGPIPVYGYLTVSIVATLIFLAATSSKIVEDLSNIELLNEIYRRIALLQNGQKILKENQEDIKVNQFEINQNINQTKKQIKNNFNEQEKQQNQNQEELIKTVEYESTNITTKIRKNLKDDFTKQEENLSQLQKSLTKKFQSESTYIRLQMETQLQILQNTLKENQKTTKKNIKTITNQKNEIADIKEKITKIEQQSIKPKPQLTSQSNLEKIRGIGPNTNTELKQIGINNIGELILADPKEIAQKTSTTEKMAKKLQGIAQLYMVPGLKEKDIALLEDIGITNQRELASQDPIEMGKKMNKILQEQIESGKIVEQEKPTLEEIHSWIKFAKT